MSELKFYKSKNSKHTEAEFTKMYEDNFDRLYHFALTFAKSPDLAKDIVSEVFLNVWKNKSRFAKINQIESYLYISVKNEAIRTLTKSQNNIHLQNFEAEIKAIDRTDPEELLLEKELLHDFQKAIEGLSPQCQVIWEMARKKQMSYKEIAAEMDLSVSAVRMQLIKVTSIIRETIASKYLGSNEGKPSQLGVISVLLTFLLGQAY